MHIECINSNYDVIILFFINVVKPTITSFTTNPPESVVGQSITIICVAIARPKPSYTIIHNGRRIVSTDNTYAISRAEWNDTGTYTCNATNALGNDLEFLNLTVGMIVFIVVCTIFISQVQIFQGNLI
jgi:hypothetical protein